MKIFKDPAKMQKWCLKRKREGATIALVPTMGYLHEGHLSLVETAKKRGAQEVIVSIFVNPVQFGPNEDYEKYPRDEKADLEKCRKAGVTAVFFPTPQNMYLEDHSVYVEEELLSRGLCGARRPGHFRGVCTVVAKLFNITAPDFAVFGRKDYQQAQIIRRMVRDYQFRGHDAAETIRTWPKVRAGENENIFPYSNEADALFDSYHVYEIAVLKKYADPILRAVTPDQPEYAEAHRMLTFLNSFWALKDDSIIPNNSILREFIGKSVFTR
jgi:pantoate--beta-alanine ligase